MAELRVEHLGLIKHGVTLLSDVSFALKPGELVALLGPNGAGKSMALKAALGLELPKIGTAKLGAEDTQTLSSMARARQLSYLPQTQGLAWPLHVKDLVALGRFSHGARLGALSGDDAQIIDEAMQNCDIAHLATRKTTTLSGGELARVHCARAFAAQTPLLIADEPVAALDPHHQFGIMDLFKTYVSKGGGVLVVLHDITLAAKYADRLIWIKDGQTVADGSPEETLTEQRLADIYAIKATVQGRSVTIEGKL